MTNLRHGLVAAGLSLLALPVALGSTPPASAVADDAAAPAYTQTKTLTRSLFIEGAPIEVDTRSVTVTASRTTELRGRERIDISWTGAHPTGGRASSPFGELGMLQEYPVVIMQCRGLDEPSLPIEQQLAPETCWTSSRMQRSQMVDETQAVWRHDMYGTDLDRAQKTGLWPLPAECADAESFSTHTTSYRAANGMVYAACTAETMPPEAAVGAAFPPAEMAAFTDLEGNGSVKFEVRSDVENGSLGCSDTVACSIVVIPIQGISCVDADVECNKAGRFESGSSNYANEGIDVAVSPQLWWAPSNWRNRFSIPLSFGLPPDACDVLDKRAPTGFYGSELMAQASLQWSPAYCLDKDRFKFQHNKMSDDAGFNLAQTGGGVAAFVSREHEALSDPMGYAPVAVTGFSIAYVIDRPDNAGEYLNLALTPRLVAKLLTQSYLGSERGRGHPGMGTNPVSLNQDPEFQQLNPGLDTIPREAGATLLSLSESSDVLTTLTSWIANDKQAAAFIAGEPDPWGMVINPNYKKIALPTSEWPLLDDYVPPTEQECYAQNPAPYFSQLAAPINSLRKIAEAVLDAWPNVQTKCERATTADPWKIGRIDRQGVGTRFMLGLVASGDARRLGLNEARLKTTGSTYVAPTDAAMAKALKVAQPSKSGDGPFVLDIKDVVKADGYPGTMIVYTAARTANLPKADAAKVAAFVRVSTTEGQRAGYGNGDLPPGYLPITKSGATAPLFRQAVQVAEEIADQSGTVPGEEVPADGSGQEAAQSTAGPGAVSSTQVNQPVPDPTVEPSATSGKGKVKKAKKDRREQDLNDPIAMPDTQAISSPLASRIIPALVAVLVAAGLLSLALGFWRARGSSQ